MPRGGFSLGLPSVCRRWLVLVLLLAALQWMEMASGRAAPQSPYPNKLGSSCQILIQRSGAVAVSPVGRGGEGTRWGGAHVVGSGFGADAGLLSPELPSCSWCTAEEVVWSFKLQWMEAAACIKSSATSSIKLAFRVSSGGGADVAVILASRHGGEGKGWHRIRVRVRLEPHQGSCSASPGSSLTAAFFSSSFSMVERRPLPPSTSATAASGRRPKDIFNLQAIMPFRRPLGKGVASSRLPVPSGVVPGDVEVGCIKL